MALAALTIGLTASVALSSSGPEGAAPNPGDIGQAIAAVVIFLLLLVVLGKYGWKPIIAQLRRREEGIAKTLQDAQKGQQEAQALLAEYRSRLDQAANEAKDLLGKSRQEATAVREQLLTAAREEARKSTEVARQDIERAKQDALKELYNTTAELAADMASQVLQESLKATDHRQIMAESLEQIRRNAAKDSQWPKR